MSLTLNTDNIGGGFREAKSFNHNRVAHMLGKMTFDSSYPTNGEALDLSAWFHDECLVVFFETLSSDYFFVYNASTKKVLVYVRSTGLEVADTTDLHTLVVNFLAVGVAK